MKNETSNELNSVNEKFPKIEINQHLHQNILHPKFNCKENISENIYYCIKCKQSTCEKCTLKEHKNHKMFKKSDFYKFPHDFFDEVEILINESFELKKEKDKYIKIIEDQAKELHNKIDEIKIQKINEIGEIFKKAAEFIKNLENNTNEVKNQYENFYKNSENFLCVSKNNDYDNSIFLLFYELNYIGTVKNKETIKSIEKLKKDFITYRDYFDSHKTQTCKLIETFIGEGLPKINMDDLYWDFKLKMKTYSEHIGRLKQNIYEIIKKCGSTKDLQELVNILDSKNKKGIQYIFNQDYFNKNHNNFKTVSNDSTIDCKQLSETKRRYKRLTKISLSKTLITSDTKTRYNSKLRKTHKNSVQYSSPGNFSCKSNSYVSLHTDRTKSYFENLGINSPRDIILDDQYKRKYFTYSLLDLNNRLFSVHPKKSYDNEAKIFVDYNKRNEMLKEYVRPIIGTNEIMIYNSVQDRSYKVKVNLIKEIHGYEKFPSGCRHLYIEGKLYICGGVDPLSCPINIALVYNPENNSIKRIENMLTPHSYHSMEYLKIYDCFVVMGGENSKSVELFDIYTKKWSKLPDLKAPRCNINIYFDEFTSELYAFFGIVGNYKDKKHVNSEIVEVLELNDISSGWYKIDYYKGSSFGIRQENVSILPFTRTKLLIYGGKSNRENENIFGIYLIDKMELIKANKDLIDKIKLEQKKIKLVNKSYGKLYKK